MAYAYRVVRSFGDIDHFECVRIDDTFRGKVRGNQFIVTRKKGFCEIFTTKKPKRDHWFGVFANFMDIDPTVGIGQF